MCYSREQSNVINRENKKDGEIPRKTVVQFSGTNVKKQYLVGLTNAEGPPVPIPNTEVKLSSVDNTSRETVREDRSRPT